ncbi:MAG: DoxX family protein [Hyphomicrobiaceae bacterium]
MRTMLLSLGRVLIASIFLISGVRKALGFAGTAQFMQSKGLPYAEILLIATVALELIGGLMIVFNRFAAPAAVLLAGFCLLSGLIFHNPWTADAAQFMNQFNHFLKNVALAGGLLFIAGSNSSERS